MNQSEDGRPAGPKTSRRVRYFNAGFLRQKRVRRILDLAGYRLSIGRPGPDDMIAVWGRSPYAARGEAAAERTGSPLIRIEDAFLRSLFPGRAGEPPLGLTIDHTGVHFDADTPSDLENLLSTSPLDDTVLMDRARGCIARLREAHLSKYSACDPDLPCPDPGYVLVIDQTRGDASVVHSGADANTFREMLYYARAENPGARILVKTHPETVLGHRKGYFGREDETERVRLFSEPVSPWSLLEGAVAVYTVSSQLGFEAIFADHRPRVFGRPFYAGWSLTDDRHPAGLPRRGRSLSRVQLFAAAMIQYPVWYDPCRDRLCRAEEAIDALEAATRAWREDRRGWTASGMRLWKRRHIQAFFGGRKRVVFRDDPSDGEAPGTGRRRMVWAGKAGRDDPGIRVEDGFLRSRGLRAELPNWNEEKGEVYTAEMYVNDCVTERMGLEAWGWNSQGMRNMTALIASVSRGLPINVATDGPAAEMWEKGKEIYYTRFGQLELACANCHEDNYGMMIRADHLSQGQTNGFPVYRLKQANLVSVQNRFRGCVRDTRAHTFDIGSDEFIALELYVASRGNGLMVEGPSVRN